MHNYKKRNTVLVINYCLITDRAVLSKDPANIAQITFTHEKMSIFIELLNSASFKIDKYLNSTMSKDFKSRKVSCNCL